MFDEPNKSSGSSILPFGYEYSPRRFATFYKEVSVVESGQIGKNNYKFSSPIDDSEWNGKPSYRHGLLLEKTAYHQDGHMVSKTSYNYNLNEESFELQLYFYVPGWAKPLSQTEKLFFADQGEITRTRSMLYNMQNRQVKQIVDTSPDGTILKTEYDYHTFSGNGVVNYISEPKRVRVYQNEELLSTKIFNFTSTEVTDLFTSSTLWRPSSVAIGVGNFPPTIKITYEDYDERSRPRTISSPGGASTAQIYGYNNSLVVAKIQNVAYNDIPPELITAIQTQSDNGNEQGLREALENLRNSPQLSNAQVTSFTYKPLVGISSITDAKGLSVFYEYDAQNRVKAVRDHLNNLLSETEYYYWTQL